MPDTSRRLRANKKIQEQNCRACSNSFRFAEEVYDCAECGGYHHLSCYEISGSCPVVPGIPIPSEGEAAREDQQEPQDNFPLVERDAPLSDTAAGNWGLDDNGPPLPPPAVTTPIAPPPPWPMPQPSVWQGAVPGAPAANPSPDEMRCAGCGGVVKRDALKCWHCGRALAGSGLSFGGYAGAAFGGGQLDPELESKASDALKYALVGILCFGFILGPIGIYKGATTLSGLSARPDYPASSSARGKAIGAIVVGCVVLLLNILGFLARLGGTR